ncbi:MAG: tetratricopeptide repeat protein [Clostridiales bacterium]|nr:tetratricopeptide repeat protein [Clostridiales bacterium]MCF8023208.1 tetratricopeptide repeat protein [Clostridiales bacterium]
MLKYKLNDFNNYNELKSHIDMLLKENNNKQAYELIGEACNKGVFIEHKFDLLFRKAFILVLCGDMTSADLLLMEIKQKDYLRYCYLKSLMLLEQGLVIEAESLCEQAVDVVVEGNADNLLKAAIYNNYGVLKQIKGSMDDALLNYQKSYKSYIDSDSKVINHSIYQNLIEMYQIKGDMDNYRKYMDIYDSHISPDNIHDFLEMHNFKLACLRQQEDKSIQIKQIIHGYYEIRKKLPKHQLRIFECSIIRMLFNAGILIINKVMNSIECNLEYYLKMNPRERFLCCKEIIFTLEYSETRAFNRYIDMYFKLNKYQFQKAISDINYCIIELAEYQIYERIALEKDKIFITKEYADIYDFQFVYNALLNIKRLCVRHNLLIEEIEVDLNIADECLTNIESSDVQLKEMCVGLIERYVDLAKYKLPRLCRHSRASEFYLLIAYYQFAINQTEAAKKYLQMFENTGISIANYNCILQSYYYEMKKRLN